MFLIIGFFLFSKKLTYLETAYITHSTDEVISIDKKGVFLEEHFQMPYNIFDSFSIYIGNYQRDSNALWKAYLLTDDETIIAQKEFGFFNASDNGFYEINFGTRLKVNKGDFYKIRLEALSVEDGNKIGFYIGYHPSIHGQNSRLYLNGKLVSGHLQMVINGGEPDLFWYTIYMAIVSLLFFSYLRWKELRKHGILWYEDKLLSSILVGIIVLLVYLPFAPISVSGTFIDENDNIMGGMLIANGKVLYRDYVTQHPPVGYYLCAIFSLLGASNVEQMRILFYILIAIGWSLLYIRYSTIFGKKVMVSMPIVIILATRVLIGNQSSMILSDVIQEMALILLMLELIYYSKNLELDWLRCLIVSFAIWLAFGCAFLSLYSIFFVFVYFLIIEIIEWKRSPKNIFNTISRYIPLIVSILLPALIGIAYFKSNHALGQCLKQIYFFNREVYVKYQGMGNNLFEPFISGLDSMLDGYISNILSIIGSAQINAYHVFMVIIISVFIYYNIKKIKRCKHEILPCILVTLLIASGATRGISDFHSLAFWGMLIAWIIVTFRESQIYEDKNCLQSLLFAMLFCILINPYISALKVGVTADQMIVNYNDTLLLEHTKEGEGIFINAYNNDSVYLLTKDRFPINRAIYCLPWYMDWYENWNIEDLKEYAPKIAVWNPEQECWGIKHYAERLNDFIQQEYSRISEESIIWKRK